MKWQAELIGHGIIKHVQVSAYQIFLASKVPNTQVAIKFRIMLQTTNHEVVLIECL